MYKGKKLAAVIPARGGSKSIPKKNIVDIGGKPLINYTIDAAKGSKYLDDIFVSTEDAEILKAVMKEGVNVIKRPISLAQDNSKTIDVIIHCLSEFNDNYDYLVLLQPTQPLRTCEHIDEAVMKIIDNDYPSLLSVSEVKHHPILIRKMNGDFLTPLMSTSSTVRRQDMEKYYAVNGAIYINRISDISADTSLNDNEYGYVMGEEYDIDIDEMHDLELLKKMLDIN